MDREPRNSDRRLYRGWWIVIVSSVFHGVFSGVFHTGFSVYFLPFQRTFQVSRTSLSTAFALRGLEGGFEGPFAGYLVDKIGPRVIVLLGTAAGGVGFILLSMVHSFTQFLIVFLGLLAIGFSTPYHGLAAAINFWFRRRLGTAMSMTAVGSAMGGFLITPVLAWVIVAHGWRVASFASGAVILLVCVPLTALIRKPRGDEAGGDDPGRPAPPAAVAGGDGAPAATAAAFDGDFTVREALHSRAYWLLALAIGLRLMAQTALLVHFVPMLVSKGVPEITAALLVSGEALMRLPAVVLGGFISDKWSRTRTSALAMGLGFVAAMALLLGPDGLMTGLLFVVLLAGAESCNNVTWALIGQFFGRRNFGTLRGGISLVQSAMSAVGPIVAGFIFDTAGDYRLAFALIGVTYLATVVVLWLLKEPSPPRREPVPRAPTNVAAG